MDHPDVVNIPAYKRKRSINAKEKNLNKQEIKLGGKEAIRKLSTRRKRVSAVADPIMDIPMFEELPQETFLEELREPTKKNSDVEEMEICGTCEGFFERIGVAVIKVTRPLRVGDEIIFTKTDGLFKQKISSMQIDHKEVTLARSGSDIGLKVLLKPVVGTTVYKTI